MKNYIFMVISIGLIFLSLFFYLATFSVNENEAVIVTRFGKTIKTVKVPGLHFKMPVDTVNRFDKRIFILETEPLQLLLKDKKPVIMTVFSAWKVENPLLFFQSVGDKNNANRKLDDMLNSSLGIILADYPKSAIFNTKKEEVKLSEIEKELKISIAKNAKKQYGIKVIQTSIERIAYPSIVIKSVYARMKSERIKEAEKIKADGAEQANKIKAKADMQASILKSQADKQALIIKGEGEKESMKIYAQAYKKDPEFFRFLKSLETYSKAFSVNTTLILSADSSLLKYLTTPKKGIK